MRPPPAELSDLPFAELLRRHEGRLWAEERYDTVHFDQLAFSGERAPDARFLECAVTGVLFEGGDLRGARLNDVWLRGTRFLGTGLVRTAWLDCAAVGCALAGTEMFGARLGRVVFRDCKFESVNLRTADLDDVVFEDCVLRDVDLGGARLTRVSFPGSALERTRLAGASLDRVDLRGATALNLADGCEALRGAVIGTTQLLDLAPDLARALGITVMG